MIYRFCHHCDKVTEVGNCPHYERTPLGYQPFPAYWDNNISEKPVFIDSLRKLSRTMKDNKMEERPREHINDLNHRRFGRGLPPIEETR